MKKLSYSLLLLLAGLALGNSALAQSGWVREKKSIYLQLSYSYFQSDKFFNLSGDELTTNAFLQHSVNFYGEYGLSDRFTVIANMPLFRSNSFETTDAAVGIGDLQLQLKYALLKGKFPVAIAVAPEFPTAQGDNFATNEQITFEQINLPTGDGEFNVWTILAASHSFESLPLYLSLYGGYNFRTEYEGREFNNQLKYGLEAGYTIADKVTVSAHLTAFSTAGDRQVVGDFIRADGTEYMSYSLGVFYKLTDKFRVLGQVQNYFDGWTERKNLYSAPILNIGVAWER